MNEATERSGHGRVQEKRNRVRLRLRGLVRERTARGVKQAGRREEQFYKYC